MTEPERKYRMTWSITCDGCRAHVQVETATDHPDETAARRQMTSNLQTMGWAVNPPADLCPECRARRGGSAMPAGADQHYMQYGFSPSGVTVRCSCAWEATAPGHAGAQMAAEVHRKTTQEQR